MPCSTANGLRDLVFMGHIVGFRALLFGFLSRQVATIESHHIIILTSITITISY